MVRYFGLRRSTGREWMSADGIGRNQAANSCNGGVRHFGFGEEFLDFIDQADVGAIVASKG